MSIRRHGQLLSGAIAADFQKSAIRGTSDPTASTAGDLTQGYVNTATGNAWFCSAIDDTDPQNVVYTWTRILMATEKGVANGLASLDSNGKVPSSELPSMGYIPSTDKGAPLGVAQLDENGKVPSNELPVPSNNAIGAIRPMVEGGLSVNHIGAASLTAATSAQLDARTNTHVPVVASNLNYAVTAALTDANKMQLTDAQKASAQDTLGAAPATLHLDAAPTTSTVGAFGQRAIVDSTGKAYTCTAVTNTGTESEPVWSYTWTDDINAKGGTFDANAMIHFSGNAGGINVGIGRFVLGSGATASEYNCFAVGVGASAQGGVLVDGSIAIGHGTRAGAGPVIAMGQYNDVQFSKLLVVGNGSSTKRSDILIADNHGLQVNGEISQSLVCIPSDTSLYTLGVGSATHIPTTASEYVLPSFIQKIVVDGKYFTRDTDKDGAGYYGWTYSNTSKYTESSNPDVGTNSYTNTALTIGASKITARDLDRTHECILTILFRGYYRSSTDDSGSASAWKATDGSLLYTDTTTITAGTTVAYSDTALTESAGTIALYDSVKTAFAMVGSYSVEDADGNDITPLSTPTIEVGSVVTFLCRWEALLGNWVVMPIPVGKEQVPA